MASPPPANDRRRRRLAVVVVLALLALAGYANSTVKDHRAEAQRAPASAVAEVVVSHRASSSAWYCPGPLPLDVGKDSAAIELANVSAHPVRGEVELVTERGDTVLHAVDLAPHATYRTSFPTPSQPSWGAASVLLNGLGVGVTEIEHGPAGPVSTPCVTEVSENAAIAGGSTHLAANVALALFDPGATPAVANVSFVTANGQTSAPPAFQGIPIGAGQLAVENVGQYLPQQSAIATVVASTGGRIVVGTMDSDVVADQRTMGLATGVAAPTSDWYLPPAPSGGSTAQSFLVLNTSPRATEVTLRTASNGSPLEVATTLKQVAPGATAQFNLARDAAPGTLRWAELSASGGATIVVNRSLAITHPISVPGRNGPPVHAHGQVVASRSPYLLPAVVPPGESAAGGSPVLARRWLLGGGESDAAASEVVTLANPGPNPVTVHLSALGAQPGVAAALAHSGSIGLAPRSVLPVNLSGIVGSAAHLTLLVSASGPVACGADLYARGSNGSVGFNASAAIPVV